MNDFEYDCLLKKRLAGQAKYRKCGSKSKKCNLLSDGMTHKQWKERCGPVVSYNLNKPMSWGTFKKLPTTVQAEYITNLQKKYGATAVDLGDMFGVRALTVRKHADANGLNICFPRGHAMSAERKAAWSEFLGAVATNIDEFPEEGCAEVYNETEISSLTTEPKAPIAPMKPNQMNMQMFSLRFSGTIDVGAIANSLKLILGEQSTGELEIICNLA